MPGATVDDAGEEGLPQTRLRPSSLSSDAVTGRGVKLPAVGPHAYRQSSGAVPRIAETWQRGSQHSNRIVMRHGSRSSALL